MRRRKVNYLLVIIFMLVKKKTFLILTHFAAIKVLVSKPRLLPDTKHQPTGGLANVWNANISIMYR